MTKATTRQNPPPPDDTAELGFLVDDDYAEPRPYGDDEPQEDGL